MPDQPSMAQIVKVLSERGQATFGTFVDGFEYLIAQAKLGNPGARAALRQLRAALRELDGLGLDVQLPREN